MQIGEALRLLRVRKGLTQTAASKREGAPDFRTLSHWESRRKLPSLKLLSRYLASLDLDFHDLQDALDQIGNAVPRRVKTALSGVEERLDEHERRLLRLELDIRRRAGIEGGKTREESGRRRAPERRDRQAETEDSKTRDESGRRPAPERRDGPAETEDGKTQDESGRRPAPELRDRRLKGSTGRYLVPTG